MASMAPAKSPALHNFALPRLKWNKDNHNHSNGRRRRRAIKSHSCESHPSSGSPLREPPHQSPLGKSASVMLVQSQQASLVESSPVCDDLMKHSPLRGESPLRNSVKQSPMSGDSVKQSPKHNLAVESEVSRTNKSVLIEYHRNHVGDSATENNRNGLYMSNLDQAIQKSEKKRKVEEADASAKRSRILRENESEENQQEEPQKINNNLDDDIDVNDEEGKINNNEGEPKTWNLRPRKPICKSLNGLNGKINGSSMQYKKTHSPLRNSSNRLGENEANGGGGQKKEKRKLSIWIAISKEEIEEDVFILTGSKPTRRPKKRERHIQKHLDVRENIISDLLKLFQLQNFPFLFIELIRSLT